MTYKNFNLIYRNVKERFRLFSHLVKNHTLHRHSGRSFSFTTLKPPWNILFFGTDDFALESLKMLHSEM